MYNSKNCKPKSYCELTKVIPNLNSIYSIPILTNKVFDCIKLEHLFFGIFEDLQFTMVSSTLQSPDYINNSNIYIDTISFKYDTIGVIINNNILDGTIKLCSKTINPIPIDPITINNTDLSNNFYFTLNHIPYNNKFCYKSPTINCKVLEKNLKFYISNLVITVTGKADYLHFIAESNSISGNLGTLLEFSSNFNFLGKICLPNSSSLILLKESFSEYLSIDCVNPKSSLQQDGNEFFFEANVELSLFIIKSLYALIEDELSVLAVQVPD